MKSKLIFYLIVFILVLFGIEVWAERSSQNNQSTIKEGKGTIRQDNPILPGIVIIKRKDAGLMKDMEQAWQNNLQKIQALSAKPLFPNHQEQDSRLSSIVQIQLIQEKDVYEAIETISHDPSVEWAEPAYQQVFFYDPDDANIGSQWYIDQIETREAWDQFKGDTTIVIGIIDTGVKLSHPDLSANIWKNPGEIPADGIDNDGNTYVDDVNGWDFGANDNDPNSSESVSILDEHLRWHGSAVAGVASAVTDNGIGMAAPAFNAKIMAVKVMDEDGILWSHISSAGVVYAADNGADIINTSFGGPASNTLLEAVNYASEQNVLVIAAAGNENSDAPSYPASYPTVLSVAGSDQNDQRAIYLFEASNYGYTIDVIAPAIQMYSVWDETGYLYWGGTSFASPLAVSVAALIKGIHPDWSANQIRQQVRVSSDPIDHLNPSFEQKLGYGRINADRALGMTFPAVQLTKINLVEGNNANNDTIFDPGEEILVTFVVKNFLEPVAEIQLDFETDNSDVTILNNTFPLPSLSTSEEWTNSGNPMRIEIDPSASRGQNVDVLLNISSPGGYQDYDHFGFSISPIYATIQGADVRLTLSSNGKLGFIDYPNNQEGEGFTFKDKGNLLFEGAVMAATAQDSVSDVARGLNQNEQNGDFYADIDGEVEIRRPGDLADEQGEAVFTDRDNPISLNLKISQTALAFQDSLDGGYVLLKYHIENISVEPLQELYFGLFLDWDVNNYYNNVPGYDADFSMAYIYDPNASIFGACQVVSEGTPIGYRSIFNEDEIYPETGGYSDAEKWAHLSGGIQPVVDTDPGDYSHVLGVGPINLSPGDSSVVGFALLGGEGLDALQANASSAREKWQTLFGTTDVDNDEIVTQPLTPVLGRNFPNPFNASTQIHYTIAEKSYVELTIHNLIGQEVFRLVDGIQESGQHVTQWNGETVQGPAASGVYFYRIKAGSFEQVRKMVLIQ